MHAHALELKDGRFPTSVTKPLGFWKAEELQKICYPASEYVLGEILPDDEYHVWILIVRITEMIFQIERSGWSDDIQLLKQIILRHNILTEDVEGLKSCVVTLHNLIHYPEDIKRFSSPDNYWSQHGFGGTLNRVGEHILVMQVNYL